MRLSFMLFVALSLFFLSGCGGTYEAYDFKKGGSSTETIGVKWQGEYTQSPVTPDTNWVYYNSRDSVVYLFSGMEWDTLAIRSAKDLVEMEGLNEVKLCWKGVRSEAPEDPQLHWAYRNRTLKTSFIWESTSWAVLIKDSDPASSLIWKGALAVQPTNPQKDWAYFNTSTGKSYLFDGTNWILLNSENISEGAKEETITWLGALSSAPLNASTFSVYYNSSDTNTYIYADSTFNLFTFYDPNANYKALEGRNISWYGTLDVSPITPKVNAVYCDFKTKSTLIWNGAEWAVLFASHHYPYNWRGVLDVAPDNPSENWAYYNAQTNKSFKYSGNSWVSLSIENIEDTTTSVPLHWLGIYSPEPTNPQINDLYKNKVNSNTYIYTGKKFELFSFFDIIPDYSPITGLEIVWLGTKVSAPSNPEKNSVYYDPQKRHTLLFNGTEWIILYAYVNFPFHWKGVLENAPNKPEVDWAYYNKRTGKSYHYTGAEVWNPFSASDLFDTIPDKANKWLGAYSSAPSNPTENDLYYNSVDSNTYIYSGGAFQLFAFQDVDADYRYLEGVEITWHGAMENPPSDPRLYGIFYESDTLDSFIWNGTEWAILHSNRSQLFSWRGLLLEAPKTPAENSAYFNAIDMKSYLFDGTLWQPLHRDTPNL